MFLITFHSTSSALYLETLLKERGVGCRVVPVPRELSSSCGYAAEVDAPDVAGLRMLMDDREVEWECVYSAADGFREISRNG